MVSIDDKFLQHTARNEQLIAVLNQKAVSLTDARTIDLHFWAWSEAGARSIAEELGTRGMVIQQIAPTQRDQPVWNVEVSVERSVDTITAPEFIREISDSLRNIRVNSTVGELLFEDSARSDCVTAHASITDFRCLPPIRAGQAKNWHRSESPTIRPELTDAPT
jgi:hypothetical protein